MSNVDFAALTVYAAGRGLRVVLVQRWAKQALDLQRVAAQKQGLALAARFYKLRLN
jgi:hypothetical protein